MYICIYINIYIYRRANGIYIQKSCSIWTVCPCYIKDFCHILDSTLKMAFLTQYHKWQKLFLLNVWVFIFPGYFRLPHLNVLCLPILLSSFVCCFISISVHRCVYLKCSLFVIFFFLLLFYGQFVLIIQ